MIGISVKNKSGSPLNFGEGLGIEQLVALTAELQGLRSHPPLVRRSDGKYEGDILGFVKGLRLSAGVVYFLRERLSSTDSEVNWGHLIDEGENSCSPECDLIVHTKGHVREWNGGKSPVMHFKFIKAESARAVISCKSHLNDIDDVYPEKLRKYGVKNVFLLAECCEEAAFPRLSKVAKKAGYRGLWCLYYTQKESSMFKRDEKSYADFGNAVFKAVTK